MTTLNKYFSAHPVLQTNVGNFNFIKQLGEGGNSYVFLFQKNDKNFVIKLLKQSEKSKTDRFKDEYFCVAQIGTHDHIARSYHFDSVNSNDAQYLIIIMEHYSCTLHDLGKIPESDEQIVTQKAWRLFSHMMLAIKHLHSNGIIHRDIKPQNIFYCDRTGKFLLGDMGIAHFDEERFAKEAETKPSDRMANYLFSPP